MCHAAYLLHVSLVCVLACAVTDCRAAEEQDQYEDKSIGRCAERAVKAGKTERGHWMKELEAAFPDKVTNPMKEEEYEAWFKLLAGKNEEWRRDDAPNPQIAELFDRVLQKLELGPVPSIKREEFMRYARRLMRDTPQGGGNAPDPNEDADKVFRVLDRNGDGELEREEFTSGLQAEKLRADADGNGRITKTEYRGYFQRKITTKADAMAAAIKTGGDPLVRGPDGKFAGKPKAGTGLPEWFTTLDADKDGQIALFEWRKGGRALAIYTEMDLNGDGLLTRDEYLRFVKMNEMKQKEEKEEKEK